ncbi:MAG: PEP-CTERM sorting domain-containing protein [Bryobacteraceae bacterium]|nr:PEP-CTERM sorting domain-containing protein [Bryobacteraceae bacterium]
MRKLAIQAVLVVSLTLAGANATTLGYSGDDPLRSFDIWFSATYQAGDQLLPAQGGGTSPGTQTINVNTSAGIANLLIDGLFTVDAICADFFTLISNGNYNVNVLGPNAINNGTRIAWMLRNTLPTINTQSDPLVKRQQAAGFQLAAWDIIHDNGDGFSAGRIQQSSSVANPTDPDVLGWAAAWLAMSNGRSFPSAYVYQNVGGASVSQTLISGVPEPGTWMMLGSALVGLGIFRRRRAPR